LVRVGAAGAGLVSLEGGLALPPSRRSAERRRGPRCSMSFGWAMSEALSEMDKAQPCRVPKLQSATGNCSRSADSNTKAVRQEGKRLPRHFDRALRHRSLGRIARGELPPMLEALRRLGAKIRNDPHADRVDLRGFMRRRRGRDYPAASGREWRRTSITASSLNQAGISSRRKCCASRSILVVAQ